MGRVGTKTTLTPERLRFQLGVICLLAFAGVLFLWQIETPIKPNYDEAHYVPASRALLAGRFANREHPPLAKYFIAASIYFIGDHQLGWRLPSVIFGMISLGAVIGLCQVVFQSYFWSLWCGLITLFNFVLFVQARIAMLDTPFAAFLMLGFLFLAKDYFEDNKNASYWAALFFGLALGTKWAGLPTIGLSFWWLRHNRIKSALLLVAIYFSTFIPVMFLADGTTHIFALQKEMLDLHLGLKAGHNYNSHWWQWPLLFRPMWYAFDQELGWVRGVFLVGNPLLFVSGFLAAVFLVFQYIFKSKIRHTFVLSLYIFSFLPWVAFPRSTSFFYYYYPAALLLGPLLVACFKNLESRKLNIKLWALVYLMVCLSLFVDFYPILAGVPLPQGTFQRWVWFKSWL